VVPERLPFQELHNEEWSFLMFARVVNGADSRMIQRRGGASFALEAFERWGVGGEGARKEFDRNSAVQTNVPGLVYLTHSACLDEL
jgi:hypothetical protein